MLAYFLRKTQILRVSNLRILRIQNEKLSGYYFYINLNKWEEFQICISVPLMLLLKTFADKIYSYLL